MEHYDSVDNLKILLKNILTTQVNNQEILDFINFCQSREKFNSIEQELLILEIYITLKQINNFIPLITYSLDAIPEKIISHHFYSFEKNKIKKDTALEKEEKKENIKNLTNCEEEKAKNLKVKENPEKEFSISEIKKKIIEYYSPFIPKENPTLKFPPVGEKYNLFIPNITIIPSKIYNAEVLIDSDGNIVDFLGDPIEQIDTDDYTKIYQGLVGQLFKFQETE